MERNSIKQVRVCLEEISDIVNQFKERVIEEFEMPECSSSEIQRRGIGINFAFGEEIHRSDDEIMYFLKEDKLIAMVLIRRTEFNNAEITMMVSDNRKFHFDFINKDIEE